MNPANARSSLSNNVSYFFPNRGIEGRRGTRALEVLGGTQSRGDGPLSGKKEHKFDIPSVSAFRPETTRRS
jgi:hypothetical protein